MRQSEPWEAIAVPMEAHSKQRGLPSRMHETSWSTGKRDEEYPPLHWSEGTATSGAQGGIAKILEVGWSKAQLAPSDHGSETECEPVMEMQPVTNIQHVGRNVTSSRNATYEACSRVVNSGSAALPLL